MTKATDLTYRVVRLPAALRTAIRGKRDEKGVTNEEFVRESVEQHLPKLVSNLQEIGFGSARRNVGAIRLPFSDQAKTLDSLRRASNDIKIPTVLLLEICLQSATAVMTPKRKVKQRRSRNTVQGGTKRKRRATDSE